MSSIIKLFWLTYLSAPAHNPDVMPLVVVKATGSRTHREAVVVTQSLSVISHQLQRTSLKEQTS